MFGTIILIFVLALGHTFWFFIIICISFSISAAFLIYIYYTIYLIDISAAVWVTGTPVKEYNTPTAPCVRKIKYMGTWHKAMGCLNAPQPIHERALGVYSCIVTIYEASVQKGFVSCAWPLWSIFWRVWNSWTGNSYNQKCRIVFCGHCHASCRFSFIPLWKSV